ncbi:MAG: diphthamide biosynthesis enzyme Dph2 [Methanomassiliicoccales archaeon]|nr:diphthamide biosynthesis enzyme Dph2 [Methanomassiliicoccales archaeon]
MYDFKLDEVAAWITSKNARAVALQMPEGLKVYCQKIMAELEAKTQSTFVVMADPCYGACDVSTDFQKFADVLVHFGHSEIPSMHVKDNIMFIEAQIEADYAPLLPELLPRLKEHIGLVTTVQYLQYLPSLKSWLEENGRKVYIGRGGGRVKYDGQILGCDISAATSIEDKVDQFLYLGTGDFHPLALAIQTKKPVTVMDPIAQEVRDLQDLADRVLRQRHGAITRASGAKRYLILVSTKPGQNRTDLAFRLRQMALENGRKADVVLMNEFDPDSLLPFEADAFVSTACPRLAVDDFLRYPKPILTPVEMEISMGLRKWSDYELDRI